MLEGRTDPGTLGRRRPTALSSIIAVVADWWAVGVCVGVFLALISFIEQKPIPIGVAIVVVPFTLAVSILFHSFLCKRVSWLSYGERLMGSVSTSSGKAWRNPFGRNRWALIIVWFVSLALEGNRWDGIYDHPYKLGSVIVGTVISAFVFWSVLGWGEGHTDGAWGVFIYQVFMAASFGFMAVFGGVGASSTVPREGHAMMAVGVALLSVTTLILMRAYRPCREGMEG